MIDVTDDPPDERPGEAPQGAPEAPAGAREGEAPATPGEAPQRRRRRRRRRKGPRPPGASQAAAPPGEARPEGEAPAPADGAAPSTPGEAPPPGSAPQHPPRRHRQRPRRHRGPRPQGAPTEATPAEGQAKPEEAPRAPYRRGVRERNFRAERRTAADAAPAEPGANEARGGNRGPRRGGERQPGERGRSGERSGDRSSERGGGRDRPRLPGKGKGPPDRGFGARAQKPEPKLYTTEAVVDRGFEDVPNPENEAETQRVHWTIVKRTVADQRTTKPVSMLYILKRGESEAEFVNLSLARAAVNKTIVHPEKLTLSKEQHALARGKK
jgi:hypothetical protein